MSVKTDDSGGFEKTFVADPNGNLETHIVEASDPGGDNTASTSYQVVRADDPTTDPPTGDVLRTYRLALITDPSYSDFSGGPANVTAAKVTLINRVSQVYEQDMSIKLQLIANDRLAEPEHVGAGDRPQRPVRCSRRCFTLANLTGCSSLARNRIVAGQIVGSGELRHRPPRARRAGRRRGEPRRRRPLRPRRRAAPASRRRPATSTRSTTSPTRWATSSAATTRSTARS